MRRSSAATLAVGLLLCGCAAGPDPRPSALAAATAGALEEIPAQALAKGQCALVLWSKPGGRRILMALDDPPRARIRIGDRSIDLPRTTEEGEAVYGQYALQTYAADGATLTLQLEFDPQRPLTGGAVLRTGFLEYKDAAGWTTLTPVGGLVACQG